MKRIPFSNVYNLRELGGHPINLNSQTRFHRFLRSDALLFLNEQEIEFLINYGVSTIIDLRNNDEVQKNNNCLQNNPSFHYIHIPFLNHTVMRDKGQMSNELISRTLDDIYKEIIDDKESIRKVFAAFAAAPGGVIFHCSAGKDRTGIITFLLLSLLNVSLLDIIADYETSFTFLTPRTQALAETYPDLKMHIMQSKPEVLINFCKYFYCNYDSAESYLKSCHIKEEELNSIKRKFTN